MLLKNEYESLDTKVHVDGLELPKMETPEAKEIGELKIKIRNLEEQLKKEICNNDCLEKGIIELIRNLGRRSM